MLNGGRRKKIFKQLLKLMPLLAGKRQERKNEWKFNFDRFYFPELLFAGCVSFQHFYNSGFCNYF